MPGTLLDDMYREGLSETKSIAACEMDRRQLGEASGRERSEGPVTERASESIMEEMKPEESFMSRLEMLFSDNYIKRIKEDKQLFDTFFDKIGKSTTRLQDYKNRGAATNGINTRDLLHKISQPTLILAGSEDKLIPVEESKVLHEKIPNSILKIFEGYGHGSLLVEDFQKVNDTIWSFIEQYIGS